MFQFSFFINFLLNCLLCKTFGPPDVGLRRVGRHPVRVDELDPRQPCDWSVSMILGSDWLLPIGLTLLFTSWTDLSKSSAVIVS